jgi:hypothetical protein
MLSPSPNLAQMLSLFPMGKTNKIEVFTTKKLGSPTIPLVLNL